MECIPATNLDGCLWKAKLMFSITSLIWRWNLSGKSWEESQNTVYETEVKRINPQNIKHAQMCHFFKLPHNGDPNVNTE